MKVLYVFNHPAPYKVKMLNELAKGCDLDVIFERKKARNRNAKFYKDNKYYFNVSFLKGIKVSSENIISGGLKRFIKKNYKNYDKIILNGYSTFAEISALNYMLNHNIPYILMVNGGVIRNDSLAKGIMKNVFISKADKCFSPNSASDEYLLHYGAKQENIIRYPYTNIGEKDLNCSSFKSNHEYFISISQFIKRKNNEELIEIFKQINHTLLLVGEGPLKKKYIEQIGDAKNITIQSFTDRESLFKMMQNSKALISLSKEDIFGHTVVEALANGLPVIASDKILSAKDLIINAKNGFLVSIENKNSIINAINNIGSINREDCINSVKGLTFEHSAQVILEALKQ